VPFYVYLLIWLQRQGMTTHKRTAQATQESLHRIFTIPEAPDSTLGLIEKEISENLAGFLGNRRVFR